MDIKKLGAKIQELPEFSSTASMYQSQYYWIQHISPFSFYGYILALEGIAVYFGQDLYKTLQANFDEKTLSFIRLHVKDDQDHIQEAFKSIEGIPEVYKEYIFNNFKQSLDMYFSILEEINQNCIIKQEFEKVS